MKAQRSKRRRKKKKKKKKGKREDPNLAMSGIPILQEADPKKDVGNLEDRTNHSQVSLKEGKIR